MFLFNGEEIDIISSSLKPTSPSYGRLIAFGDWLERLYLTSHRFLSMGAEI